MAHNGQRNGNEEKKHAHELPWKDRVKKNKELMKIFENNWITFLNIIQVLNVSDASLGPRQQHVDITALSLLSVMWKST